jgi:hypothetical protein
MSGQMEKINSHIETLSLEVVTLEENDIPGVIEVAKSN